MSETFSTFKFHVSEAAFPEELPEQAQRGFEYDLLEGLIYVQRWVPYFKRRNRDIFPFCSSLFFCGATVIEKPRGHISRLYTLEGNCCPVFYSNVEDYDQFMNWLVSNRKRWTEPPNEGMPTLPRGFKFAEAVTDKGKRFSYGYWNVNGPQIFIGQRIESTESVVIEWEGIRRKYADSDLMPYDDADEGDSEDMGVELKNLLVSYVLSEHMRKRERSKDWKDERAIFDNKLAEMKYDDRNDTIPKAIGEQQYDGVRYVTGSETCRQPECVEPASVTTESIFAIIGDYGEDTVGAASVAAMVTAWEPAFIATLGDNWYGSANTEAEFLALAKTPYDGFTLDPTMGNHDRDPVAREAISLAGFPFPKVFKVGGLLASTGYYDIVRGFVHHFHYDSGFDNLQVNQQADGVGVASKQFAWLKTRLLASTSPFKIVYMHHPGYTSTASGGVQPTLVGDGKLNYTDCRAVINALKVLGVDVVMHGHCHNYERLTVDGLPIIINGLGGRELYPFAGSPSEFSVIRFAEEFGAMKCTSACDSLTLEFIDIVGVVRDTLEITK